MRTPWLLCCLLVTATSPVLADLYKWTDSSGVVQYTAIPPAQGVPFEVIDKPPTPSTDPKAAMQQLLDKANHAGQEEKKPDPGSEDRKQLNVKNCELAKTNLEMLQNKDRDIVTTDSSGKKTLLSAEQRETQIKQAQKDISYFCAQ